MITLNLQAESPEFQALKAYLEENVSEILADKINNGVKIEKDGKTLINKKTLETFMDYAHGQAKNLAAKNARYACITHEVVFSWAIHYFEEDDIIGTLYNEDGTPYSKPIPTPTSKPVQPVPATVVSKPNKPENKQYSLFDLMAAPTPEPVVEEPKQEIAQTSIGFDVDEETGEIISETPAPTPTPMPERKGSSIYQAYMRFQKEYPHAVIAYRLGDFYEVFGDGAVKIANTLELTLTARDCGLEERVPMIGFPYHSSDTYFRKIAVNSKLVIVEDNEATIYVPEQKKPVEMPVKEQSPPTVSQSSDDLDRERELSKFFDKDALCVLYELFDYNLDMQ